MNLTVFVYASVWTFPSYCRHKVSWLKLQYERITLNNSHYYQWWSLKQYEAYGFLLLELMLYRRRQRPRDSSNVRLVTIRIVSSRFEKMAQAKMNRKHTQWVKNSTSPLQIYPLPHQFELRPYFWSDTMLAIMNLSQGCPNYMALILELWFMKVKERGQMQ